jgi:outer membrane biosynthesis protein TonB
MMRSARQPAPRVTNTRFYLCVLAVWAICLVILGASFNRPSLVAAEKDAAAVKEENKLENKAALELSPEKAAEAKVVEKRILDSARYLASDELEGRGIGTKGLDLAADYIAKQFADLGLKTQIFDGGPFQKFKMVTQTTLGPKNEVAFVHPAEADGKPAQTIDLKLKTDYTPMAIGGSGKFDLPLVFVGYGITGKDEKYDDYEGINVEGKAVIILRHEPEQDNPHSLFNGKDNSPHAPFARKLSNAYEHGAALVIFCTDEYEIHDKTAQAKKRWQEAIDELTKTQAKFNGLKVNEPAPKADPHADPHATPHANPHQTPAPKANGEKPAAETPKQDPHKSEAPKPDSKKTETPKPEAPKTKDPPSDPHHAGVDKTKPASAAKSNPADPATLEARRVEVDKLLDRIRAAGERMKGEFDPMLPFDNSGPGGETSRIPVLHCRRAALDGMIKAALGKDLATLEREIDNGPKPHSAELPGWRIKGEVTVERKEAEVKNVVAILEGEGPHADETIVIGAHYDHLGFGGPGSFVPNEKVIHNGADDNGSGTAVLLEVARLLASREKKLPRRVVFIAFTGEERGLIGSARYCREPALPLDKTVAMLNMDMVGRLSKEKLIIQGVDTATEFGGIIDQLNKHFGFEITRQSGGFGPSDHSSFYSKKIPVMHFFTGTHNDYHRPSDDYDKLNVPGMRRIGELVAETAVAIADAGNRPTYLATKAPAARLTGGGDRPYLGTIPDFGGDEPGYALNGVAQGGPAEKGGLKGGDIIIKFGDSKIGGIEDIESALRKHKAGDKVPVVVKRAGAEVKLEVVLDPPR